MRFVMFESATGPGLALATSDGGYRGLQTGDDGFPGTLETLVRAGRSALETAARVL